MDKQQLIKTYSSQIERTLERAYSSGYENGYENGHQEVENIRGTCVRVKGEHDEEYSSKWEDDTPFYGWCNKCNRPHSGRWAHVWEFCPWCGAKIDYAQNQAYPTGLCQKEEIAEK